MRERKSGSSKRERLYSRPRMVLRRLAIFLIALLAVNHIMQLGFLLPVQAIRQVEERQGAPHGQTLARLWTPEVHGTHLVYLRGGENAVTIADTYLSFYGWMGGFGWALDCTREEPLYAGEMTMYQDNGRGTVCCYYGRVDAPEITRVEISVRGAYYDETSGTEIWEETANLPVEGEGFIQREEGRYFLVEDVIQEWPYDSARRAWVIGYDETGTVVTEFKIEEGTHSYFG